MFRELGNLEKLNLMSNRISLIERGTFEDLRQLIMLNLNNNQVHTLDPLAYSGLDNLQKLYMESNHLSLIPRSAFVRMHSLRHINLARNNLSDISSRMFVGVSKLEELFLSDNNIINIASDTFTVMPLLKVLNMGQNNIHTINKSCEKPSLKKLQELYLANNPLECTCKIAWIHKLVLTGTKVEGKCRGPDLFRENRLMNLNFTLCDTEPCA